MCHSLSAQPERRIQKTQTYTTYLQIQRNSEQAFSFYKKLIKNLFF